MVLVAISVAMLRKIMSSLLLTLPPSLPTRMFFELVCTSCRSCIKVKLTFATTMDCLLSINARSFGRLSSFLSFLFGLLSLIQYYFLFLSMSFTFPLYFNQISIQIHNQKPKDSFAYRSGKSLSKLQ